MKMAGRIPAEQVSAVQTLQLPAFDDSEKKFKVQKRKPGRFTDKERRARKRKTQPGCDQPGCVQQDVSDQESTDAIDLDLSGCAQPSSAADGSGFDAGAAGVTVAEDPGEADAVQTDATEAAADPPVDAGQQARDEGYEAGKEEGRKAGLQQGIEQGSKKYAAEVRQKIHTLDTLIDQLRYPMMQNGEDLGASMARLIMEISRRVVLRELEIDEKQIVNVVLKALDALPHGANSIKIFLAPADIQIIEEMMQVNSGKWQLIEDANLSLGGCRIETSTSFIDYTLEKRFNDCLDAAFGTDLRLHASQGESAGLAPQLNSAVFTGSNTASVSGSISNDLVVGSPTERSPTERSPTIDTSDET